MINIFNIWKSFKLDEFQASLKIKKKYLILREREEHENEEEMKKLSEFKIRIYIN